MLEKNLSFAKGLNPLKSRFYEEFCEYCAERNILFKTVSGLRSYEEQLRIYTKGRNREDCLSDLNKGQITKKGYNDLITIYDAGKNLFDTAKRTWTLASEHIDGFGIDLQLINTTHPELELICMKWNILHPFPALDPAHYSLRFARSADPSVQISPIYKLKGLERRFSNTKSPSTKNLILSVIGRLKERIRL